MSNGKSKGSDFERYCSKQLSIWLTGTERPYNFWRSPSSGGLATISELNQDLSGDIIGLTIEAKEICSIISIEAKTGYPKTSFWQHFKDIKNFNIKLFWQQCVNDANKKFPVLIYRKKGSKPIIGINLKMDKEINKSVNLNILNSLIVGFKEDEDLPLLKLYDMEDFLDNVKPEIIKKLKL